MSYLGLAVLATQLRGVALISGLRGDESDGALFLDHNFFSSEPRVMALPVYRGIAKSGFEYTPALAAAIRHTGDPVFINHEGSPIPPPRVINLGKERTLICRVGTIAAENSGKGSGWQPLEELISTCQGVRRIEFLQSVRDTRGAFIEMRSLGFAETEEQETRSGIIEGVIAPRWNPSKREAGGRQSLMMFLGEGGLALLEKYRDRLVGGEITQVR